MPSRRDQLHSYQFLMQRVVSSVIVHETDPEQTPLRRGVGALFGGVMVAGLVALVFGVVGVITQIGGDGWRTDGAIVIERETGATYVYRDGALQPVLNYASARLLGGGAGTGPHRVSSSGLADLPRRPVVGIPGAPDSLPGNENSVTGPWTMCTISEQEPTGARVPATVLLVGEQPTGAEPLGQWATLVRDADTGASYLVWRGHRYPIAGAEPDNVIRSLYGAQRDSVDVGAAWLNGLPMGEEIGPIPVPGRGEPSAAVPGYAVGEVVYHPISNGDQSYLVLADGLAPITDLQVRILAGQYSVTPREVSSSMVNDVAVSGTGLTGSGDTAPPETPPVLAANQPDAPPMLCSVADGADGAVRVQRGGTLPAAALGIETTRESSTGTRFADRVHVPPGRVAVVRVMPSDTAEHGAINLVTDLGLRFPVPSADELSALGYDLANAVSMPANLVQRIPAGPALSAAAATRAVPVAGP